jgi:DnaK suppressor protein
MGHDTEVLEYRPQVGEVEGADRRSPHAATEHPSGAPSLRQDANEVRGVLKERLRELLDADSHRAEIVITDAGDEFDRLQQQLSREVAVSTLERQSQLAKEIQAALRRLDEGSYGLCLGCERPIPPKRLVALPWAAHCVVCQEALDREHVEKSDDKRDSFALSSKAVIT